MMDISNELWHLKKELASCIVYIILSFSQEELISVGLLYN